MRADDVTDAATESPHPRIARFIDLWRSLAPGPALLPGRQHFDPLMVPDLLANLWLVDVDAGSPRRYRYRLIGGKLVDAGMPARKGDLVDDPRFSQDPVAIRSVFDTIVESREPGWARGEPMIRHSKFVLSLERVILPLATDGRTIDMMLCMTLFHHMDGKFG
jgi:hypothetical protein